MTGISHNRTILFGNWLVAEAGRYENVRTKSKDAGQYRNTINGVEQREPRLTRATAYVELARIIQKHLGRDTDFDVGFMKDLYLTVVERQEVSDYYSSLPRGLGSAFDEDNKRHQSFNDCLAEVEAILMRTRALGVSSRVCRWFNRSRSV